MKCKTFRGKSLFHDARVLSQIVVLLENDILLLHTNRKKKDMTERILVNDDFFFLRRMIKIPETFFLFTPTELYSILSIESRQLPTILYRCHGQLVSTRRELGKHTQELMGPQN